MTKYLEIKITLPLPESWVSQVKLAGNLAPAQDAFNAALVALGLNATITERTYTPKQRHAGPITVGGIDVAPSPSWRNTGLSTLDEPALPIDAA